MGTVPGTGVTTVKKLAFPFQYWSLGILIMQLFMAERPVHIIQLKMKIQLMGKMKKATMESIIQETLLESDKVSELDLEWM